MDSWPSEEAFAEMGDEAESQGSGCQTAEVRAGRDVLGEGAEDSAAGRVEEKGAEVNTKVLSQSQSSVFSNEVCEI